MTEEEKLDLKGKQTKEQLVFCVHEKENYSKYKGGVCVCGVWREGKSERQREVTDREKQDQKMG